MSVLTWATMAIVLGIVWGGFFFALIMAMRNERRK